MTSSFSSMATTLKTSSLSRSRYQRPATGVSSRLMFQARPCCAFLAARARGDTVAELIDQKNYQRSDVRPRKPARRPRGIDVKVFRAAIGIEAPADRVWGVLTDIAHWSDWNTTVDKVDGRVALGAKVTVYAKVSPGRAFPVKV